MRRGRLPASRGGYTEFEFELCERLHVPHPRLLTQMLSEAEIGEWHAVLTKKAREAAWNQPPASRG